MTCNKDTETAIILNTFGIQAACNWFIPDTIYCTSQKGEFITIIKAITRNPREMMYII